MDAAKVEVCLVVEGEEGILDRAGTVDPATEKEEAEGKEKAGLSDGFS